MYLGYVLLCAKYSCLLNILARSTGLSILDSSLSLLESFFLSPSPPGQIFYSARFLKLSTP